MAKAAKKVGTVTFRVPNAPVVVEGILVEQTETSVTLDVKRPRSSKYDRRVFSTSDALQFFVGEEAAYLTLRGDYTEVYADVTIQEVTSEGVLIATTEAGETVVCAAGTWELELSEVEETKPAKAGKKPAKNAEPEPEDKDDDDEPDEDDEDEEEEDVKPAKKAAKKAEKAKPAKKAGKKPAKNAEPDEDDEDEEGDDEDEDDDDEW